LCCATLLGDLVTLPPDHLLGLFCLQPEIESLSQLGELHHGSGQLTLFFDEHVLGLKHSGEEKPSVFEDMACCETYSQQK
jgi:hypothetical protein